jgi:hypothetical protein
MYSKFQTEKKLLKNLCEASSPGILLSSTNYLSLDFYLSFSERLAENQLVSPQKGVKNNRRAKSFFSKKGQRLWGEVVTEMQKP